MEYSFSLQLDGGKAHRNKLLRKVVGGDGMEHTVWIIIQTAFALQLKKDGKCSHGDGAAK